MIIYGLYLLIHPLFYTMGSLTFMRIIVFLAHHEVKQSTPLDTPSAPVCPTPGCHGVGNVKGPRYLSHNSLEACPYSPQNIGSESLIPDRLQGSIKRHEGPIVKPELYM